MTANAHSPTNASLEKGSCFVRMTSTGTLLTIGRITKPLAYLQYIAEFYAAEFNSITMNYTNARSYFEIFRRYGTKCAGCCLGISPNDMVRRAKHLVFHVKCFNSSSCNRQILTGDELYYVGESKFVCKEDYYQSRFPSKHSGEWKGNWFVY